MLSKNEIVAAQDRKIIKVEVPEWNGEVGIALMNAADRDSWENEVISFDAKGKVQTKKEFFRLKLLVRTLVDDRGIRLFSDEEILELGKKSSEVILRLFEKSMEVNKLSKSDADELEKN